MGDSLPGTEGINKLGSGYSRWIVYQQGPHSSVQGLLPAGPEAEITFCCRSRIKAVSPHMPPSVPLGTSECAWWHHWCAAAVRSWHRAGSLSSAGSAPSAPCVTYGTGREAGGPVLRLIASNYGHLSHNLSVQHKVASVA